MKKFLSVLICISLVFTFFVSAGASFRDPVDGIIMSPGLNPVVMHTSENIFEYAVYARDMDKMRDGDFVVTIPENAEVTAFEDTSNCDVLVYNVVGNEIYISFMYEEYNPEDAVKMFVITFTFTGEAEYPSIRIDNLAGTFIKKIADVVVKENKGDDTLSNGGVLGDVTLDTAITAADARLILRHASKLEKLTGAALKNADADKDGKITASDARLVLRVAAGYDAVLK